MKTARTADDDFETDTGPGAVRSIVRRQAGSAPMPSTTAPVSIFAAGKAAKRAHDADKPPRRWLDFDPLAVEIKTGPVPKRATQSQTARYLTLWNRIGRGQYVDLDARTAEAFLAWLKKRRLSHCRRTLAEGRVGVWRLE